MGTVPDPVTVTGKDDRRTRGAIVQPPVHAQAVRYRSGGKIEAEVAPLLGSRSVRASGSAATHNTAITQNPWAPKRA